MFKSIAGKAQSQYSANYRFTADSIKAIKAIRTLTKEQSLALNAVLSGKPTLQDCATLTNAMRMYGIDVTAYASR